MKLKVWVCALVFQLVEETAAKARSQVSPSQEVQQELTKAQEELKKAREELNTLKEEVQKKQEEVSRKTYWALTQQTLSYVFIKNTLLYV